jgi:hypothetical protein
MPISQGGTHVQGFSDCGVEPTEGFPVQIQGCAAGIPVPVTLGGAGACVPVEGCPDGDPVVAVLDFRRAAPGTTPQRYMIALTLVGVATDGANIGGLRKLAANPDVFITSIIVFMFSTGGTGNGVPIRFIRASAVAGGTQITAADIPKKNSAAADATLEVRTGAVTGTEAAQPFFIAGSSQIAGANFGGPQYVWKADEIADQFVLTGDEGIIIEQAFLGATTTNRYLVVIEWEEA